MQINVQSKTNVGRLSGMVPHPRALTGGETKIFWSFVKNYLQVYCEHVENKIRDSLSEVIRHRLYKSSEIRNRSVRHVVECRFSVPSRRATRPMPESSRAICGPQPLPARCRRRAAPPCARGDGRAPAESTRGPHPSNGHYSPERSSRHYPLRFFCISPFRGEISSNELRAAAIGMPSITRYLQ